MNKKRKLLALLFFVFFSFAFASCASKYELTFDVNGGNETEYNVRKIGDYAFYYINENNNNTIMITQLTISDGVTSIGNGAFYKYPLSNIDVPDSVQSIGWDAFYGCTGLNSIVISNNVTQIDNSAFYGCNNLTIYSEYENAPKGWDTNFVPVIWGCTLSEDKTYVVSIDKTETTSLGNNPYRSGYTFDGWYDASDCSGTKYETIGDAPIGTLYAKWLEQ